MKIMDISLRDGIDWVGYVDWNLRDFHGYNTLRGATYNSYLIRDKKIALVDAVKAPFSGNLLSNIHALIGNRKIDFFICNHAESDHSGSIPAVMNAYPDALIVCTEKCEKTLGKLFDTSGWKFRTVKTGDSISLGDRTLEFIETPMVHWPESMFTYLPEEKILFSMDAFGQHYATSQRFDDEISLGTALFEAKIYYANIVMPFSRQCIKATEDVSGLDIEMIAPSHGVIWRSHVKDILDAYSDWIFNRFKRKVLVIYDTMWNSTERMAEAIYEGACIPGVDVRLINIRKSNLTNIAAEILDAAAVAFGSATLNRDMMPMAHAVMSYLNGLRPEGRIAFAFGSYGWGKGGVEEIEKYFGKLKWEVVRDPVKSNYAPTPEVLDECNEAGRELAKRAFEIGAENIS